MPLWLFICLTLDFLKVLRFSFAVPHALPSTCEQVWFNPKTLIQNTERPLMTKILRINLAIIPNRKEASLEMGFYRLHFYKH